MNLNSELITWTSTFPVNIAWKSTVRLIVGCLFRRGTMLIPPETFSVLLFCTQEFILIATDTAIEHITPTT